MGIGFIMKLKIIVLVVYGIEKVEVIVSMIKGFIIEDMLVSIF